MASDKNVRKTRGQAIEDLAASIQAHGLLHNLVVSKASKDKYQVIAGARRFAALTKLAKDKAISKTFGVPCRVIDSEASTESSLAENIIRQNMHPADQFVIPPGSEYIVNPVLAKAELNKLLFRH
jgi:ParB family chromosome partitioning protein